MPEILGNLLPEWSYLRRFREQESQYKKKQKKNYDERYRARPLADILNDQPVWVNIQMDGNSKAELFQPLKPHGLT